ncbi:MAG: aminotransferase class V-fold PLP-dependent enzyme [Myxococcales bacterium]|nr:aminotransferase class V-fold PLP-dependent enzyme [Myxococcales bacterium]
MATLDVGFCRRQFPALGSDWALLDNAGGSVTPRQVTARITEHLERRMVQLGASYPLSEESTARVLQGREAVAALMNATRDEVVLGASTTQNLGLLARALRLAPGDEVVVSNLDHESNVGCWRQLEARGVVVREWRAAGSAEDPGSVELRFEELEPLLGSRTRWVCFSHCSNLVGAVHDVATLTRQIQRSGARVCVDGVAYAPHRAIDVRAWGVDAYAFSLYKTYGPHLGALFLKRELQEELTPQNHFFIDDEDPAYRFMPGGVSHELAAGLPGILEYLDAVHAHHFPEGTGSGVRERLQAVFELFGAHEARLSAALLEILASLPEVRVLGPASASDPRRAPTIGFWRPGLHSSRVPEALDARQVAVRWGHFYAHRLVGALGLHEQGGVVRASFVHYNTLEEAARLGAALVEVLG